MDSDAREKLKAEILQSLVDLPEVGKAINGMIWRVATLTDFRSRFLTSDRPLVMTRRIGFPTSYIILPISPRALFIAVNTTSMLSQLKEALDDGRLVDHVNHTVAAQAKNFVYFTDDSQLCFVEDRLGKYPTQFVAPDEQTLRARLSLNASP